MQPSRLIFIMLLGVLQMLISTSARGQFPNSVDPRDAEWARSYNGMALICRTLGMTLHSDLDEWFAKDADQKLLIVLGNPPILDVQRFVDDGSALLYANDNGAEWVPGISLSAGPLDVVSVSDCFPGCLDCPIVTKFGDHPCVEGLTEVQTNQTGGIRVRSRWKSIADLPPVEGRTRNMSFAAVSNDPSKRVLVCSDPSVFTNMLLYHRDNAIFTLKSLHWLKDGKRTEVLLIVDGTIATPENPQTIDQNFPPPSREQVLNALRQLPPDVMIQFGNELARVVEDEGLTNDLLAMAQDEIPPIYVNRFVIFLLTFLLAAFVFYRYLVSESTIQEAAGTEITDYSALDSGRKNSQAAKDRMVAARALVAKFYSKISNGARTDYATFPRDLGTVNCSEERSVGRQLKKTGRILKSKPPSWWTQRRLLELQSKIEHWAQLHDLGQLEFRPTHNQSNISREAQ